MPSPHPLLSSPDYDLDDGDPTPPSWQMIRLKESDDREVLVLKTDHWTEATGINATTVHERLQRMPHVDTVSHLRALRDGGVPASDLEMAVHARVRAALWHGGFASACVHLLPLSDFAERLDADAIRHDPCAIGVMDQDPNGPPYLTLARDGARTECLILTWCREWQAFRGVVQTKALCPGETFFAQAFANHMRAVIRLLGNAAVLPPGPASAACAN